MIQVTPRAAQHLIGVRSERGFPRNAGARFIRMSNGVGMSYLGAPRDGDRVIASTGIQVFVPPEVERKLGGTTLDVAEKEGRTNLVLRAANFQPALRGRG